MAKRHLDALNIQVGASNPNGILNSICEARAEINQANEEARQTTPPGEFIHIKYDPAIRLMLHHLAEVMGCYMTIPDWGNDIRACIAACHDQMPEYLRHEWRRYLPEEA